MLMPYPVFFVPWTPYTAPWRPAVVAYGRPAAPVPPYVPARHALGILGEGPGAILPGLEFFVHGHTIGGPTGTSYRGVSASSFPVSAIVFGSGAPIDAEWLGLAGAPIGPAPGRAGQPFL